jgi:nitrite reductase/ring-hydroxylating ferredoxin subunit/ketosteroid isomerase-like protein
MSSSVTSDPSLDDPERTWVGVGSAADITRRKKVVTEIGERQILVLAHEGRFFAFDNICIHRQRELSKGVVLNGKIVCPGHQWAFALDTGWEAVKQECQPTHAVRVTGDLVEVGLAPVSTESVDRDSVRAWIDAWGAEVAAVDIDAARLRFASDVSAFGTHADVVVGLDRLVTEQWSEVWPAIEDFRFLTDEMRVTVSADRLLAIAVVGWTSTGIAEDASRFARPGRATIVVRRAAVDEPWLGVHTHFSLGRGVPQNSHGARPRSS